jgi:IS30 family transposase
VNDTDIAITHRRPTPGLDRPERQHVSRNLTAHGLSAREIARILAVNPRTVVRYRAEDRTNHNTTTEENTRP